MVKMCRAWRLMMSRLVPKLRFDGFSEEWEEKSLGNVVKFLDGKRKPIKESDRANMQGEYPYYGASGIIDYVNDYIFDEDLILLGEDGENIVSRNLPLVFKVSGKSWINNHAHVLKPISPYNLDFLVQYMETLSYIKYNSGGAQPKLNQAVCKTIPLILPKEPPEQQKIANCLSSLNALIEAQNKKVEALKKHKKGLMQGLFPKDGEKVPKLRFDGFFGEWEEKRLGELIDNIGGTALEKYTNSQSTYKFISIGNYGTDGKYIDNGQRIELNDKTKTKLLDKNNLVMVLNDKTAMGDIIGSTILIDKDDSYIYNQRSERLICKSKILPIFAWCYLNSELFRKSVYSISQGGTQIYVNFPSIKNLKIYLPTLEEQQNIANCLSSLDALIEAQNKKVEALNKHKKGLMQMLFVGSGA